jgi:hypothetical protein
MSAPTAAQLAALRKATHVAAKGFASYNFRQCQSHRSVSQVAQSVRRSLLLRLLTLILPRRPLDFVRRTALRFDAAPALTAPELPSWYEARLAELEVLKRASVVNKIFEGPKLVVERDGEIEVRTQLGLEGGGGVVGGSLRFAVLTD